MLSIQRLFATAAIILMPFAASAGTITWYDGNACQSVSVVDGATSLHGFRFGNKGFVGEWIYDHDVTKTVGYQISFFGNDGKSKLAVRFLGDKSKTIAAPLTQKEMRDFLAFNLSENDMTKAFGDDGLNVEVLNWEGGKGNIRLTVKLSDPQTGDQSTLFLNCPYY